jgi:hypothetical protein
MSEFDSREAGTDVLLVIGIVAFAVVLGMVIMRMMGT